MKTNKKHVVIYIGFLTVFFFTFAFLAYANEQKNQQYSETNQLADQLVTAVQQTGAAVESIQFHHGSILPLVETADDLLQLGRQWEEAVIGKLNLPEDQVQVTYDGNGINPFYQINYAETDVSVSVRIAGSRHGGQWHPYLVVKVKAPFDRFAEVKQAVGQLADLLRQQSVIPQFNTCVQAFYSDKLKIGIRTDKVKQILHNFDAEVVETMQDYVVQSISAYSPLIPRGIYTNGVKMNLQVATHVDPQSNITRLTVGTPIITTTY